MLLKGHPVELGPIYPFIFNLSNVLNFKKF